MLDTNVFALTNLTRLATAALKQTKGDIVNISSTAAKSMIAGGALYSATKAAVAVSPRHYARSSALKACA